MSSKFKVAAELSHRFKGGLARSKVMSIETTFGEPMTMDTAHDNARSSPHDLICLEVLTGSSPGKSCEQAAHGRVSQWAPGPSRLGVSLE